MPKVKCLVLDHDDTVVKSTPQINYPAFQKALSVLRPAIELDYETFIELNFKPGFYVMCTEHFGFSEMAYQEKVWKEASAKAIPDVYEGLPDILNRYASRGGKICVSSHSLRATITRDYLAAGMPEPDLIFDWECPDGKRKPDPYALKEIMRIYGFKPEELLMVDDLKPGYDMASSCGVPFACAGWSENQIPVVKEFMRQYGTYYLETTNELERILYE